MKIAALVPVFLLLTACGQSGDLYLPPPEPAAEESTDPASATEPDRKKKD